MHHHLQGYYLISTLGYNSFLIDKMVFIISFCKINKKLSENHNISIK